MPWNCRGSASTRHCEHPLHGEFRSLLLYSLVSMAANHAHMHMPQPQNEGYVKIASLLPQMNSINTFGIVLENRELLDLI
ncbi:unnamed protein product [Nippostrongylus brasiliensis]|uniref:Secreted protein n=1 Tax=Nippostrongylus brasiliensis TaxID=27835 RepID=A0A0N4XKV9_NIPBR|nr:unnamed protein product [Nippostrongylus brasiliensis]